MQRCSDQACRQKFKVFVLDREDYVQRVLVHLDYRNTFMEIEDKTAAIKAAKLAITNWCDQFAEEDGMTNTI